MNENRESFCPSLAKSVRTTQKGLGPGVPGKLFQTDFKATRLVRCSQACSYLEYLQKSLIYNKPLYFNFLVDSAEDPSSNSFDM